MKYYKPLAIKLWYSYSGNGIVTLSVAPVTGAMYYWQKCDIKTTQWLVVATTNSNSTTIIVNPAKDIGVRFRCLLLVNNKVTRYSNSLVITQELLTNNNNQHTQTTQENNHQNNSNQKTRYEHTPSVDDTDGMDGLQFERYCAGILRKNGFIDVRVTQGSGDYGIDITAKKDSVSYAIQCKCYSGQVSNKAVQEAFSGKTFYNCMVAAVLTNSFFTDSAKETAKRNAVILWNRMDLDKMIKSAYAKQQSDSYSNNNSNAYQQYKQEQADSASYRTKQQKNDYSKESKDETKRNSNNESTLPYFRGCNNWEQVRERYKNLMRTFHPDGGSGDVETAQEINAQYELLKKKYGQ